MRIIKFRAKSVDTNEWVYGFYYIFPTAETFIQTFIGYNHRDEPYFRSIPVIHETVGQFTGFVDRPESTVYNELYEHDYVSYYDNSGQYQKGEILFVDGKWKVRCFDGDDEGNQDIELSEGVKRYIGNRFDGIRRDLDDRPRTSHQNA